MNINEIEMYTKGIEQGKHFNCEIYTASMYLQIKTASSGIF